MEPGALQWHSCRVVRGYGVASGQAEHSPYPAGTISLQTPLLAEHGIDLSAYHPGTLNLAFDDSRWRLRHPDAHVAQLAWSDRHPPETFSFWRVQLRWQGCDGPVAGLIYWPHPETKQRHHHSADRLELLVPWIDAITERRSLELGVDPRRCHRIRPLTLQAQLLEALKFRVLASQEDFFTAFHPGSAAGATAFRAWLPQVMPQAADLEDTELHAVLERARFLYCDGIGCDTTRPRSGLA